jgi:glycosyltransferase involved in cell wall biosynthesis
MGDVVLFDPRGSFSTLDKDLISRHKEYLKASREFPASPISRLVILTGKVERSGILYHEDNLIIVGCKRKIWLEIFINFRKSNVLNGIDFEPQIITCSDPWASYFYARLSSIFRIRNVSYARIPFQLQIHADFLTQNWRRSGVIPLVKFIFAKYAIKQADQIRCVSNSIAMDISTRFNISATRIISVPVPINVAGVKSVSEKSLPLSIGFVGRLHAERGLDVFSKAVTSLFKIEPRLKVIVIGDGPERESLRGKLLETIPSSQLEMLGHLNTLEDAWGKIGILLSTAPTESYGRSTREALMHGIPVWGVKSRGIDELIAEAGNEVVRELNVQLSSQELGETLRELLAHKRNDGYYLEYLERRREIIKDIGSAWARLAKTCQ